MTILRSCSMEVFMGAPVFSRDAGHFNRRFLGIMTRYQEQPKWKSGDPGSSLSPGINQAVCAQARHQNSLPFSFHMYKTRSSQTVLCRV